MKSSDLRRNSLGRCLQCRPLREAANMPNIEYTVMATDFAGHSFEHTYIRSTPDNVFKEPLNQPVVMAFTSSITDALRPTIMSAAPWVCARCRQKPSHFATRVLLMKPTDPQYELQVVDLPANKGLAKCMQETMSEQLWQIQKLEQTSSLIAKLVEVIVKARSVVSVKALHTVVRNAKSMIGQVTKLLAKF